MSATAALGAIRLVYDRTEGEGDPVVIVPGAWGDRRGWVRIHRGLAESGLHVLTYDRRGRGESAGPPSGRPVEDDASDLAQLLEEIDLRPVHLLAAGTAAAVGLRIAYERPELVRSLLLHDPPLLDLLDRPTEATGVQLAFQAVARSGGEDSAGSARAYLRLTDRDPQAWESLAPSDRAEATSGAAQWGPELSYPGTFRAGEGVLRALGVSVFATVGEHSAPFFAPIVERLSVQAPFVSTVTIPEVGDLPQAADPPRYIGVLTAFLVERTVPST